MRETIKVKANGKEYEFFAVANVMEESRINATMAEMLGGWDNLTKMESTIDDFYRKHIEFNEKKFGDDVFAEKQNKLIEFENTKSDEFMELFLELNNNPHYLHYTKLLTRKMELKYTAMIIVLNASGEDMEDISPKEMEGLLKEVRPLWASFRKKDEEAKKTIATDERKTANK